MMEELEQKIIKFCEERDWSQFHNPKDLSVAISIEASELLELFLWKDSDDIRISKEDISDELADILIYSIILMKKLNLDYKSIILNKLAKNAIKYPITIK